jgi:hypothetical protein
VHAGLRRLVLLSSVLPGLPQCRTTSQCIDVREAEMTPQLRGNAPPEDFRQVSDPVGASGVEGCNLGRAHAGWCWQAHLLVLVNPIHRLTKVGSQHS